MAELSDQSTRERYPSLSAAIDDGRVAVGSSLPDPAKRTFRGVSDCSICGGSGVRCPVEGPSFAAVLCDCIRDALDQECADG